MGKAFKAKIACHWIRELVSREINRAVTAEKNLFRDFTPPPPLFLPFALSQYESNFLH